MATKRLEITVLSGVSAGDVFRFDIEDGAGVTLGRAEDCDVVLQDPMVSRRHAKLRRQESRFYLSDLGSTHGTTHMGFTLVGGDTDERMLRSSDEFKVGQSMFRVAFDEEQIAASSQSVDDKGNLRSRKFTKKAMMRWGAVGVALVVLVVLLIPEEKPGLPTQQSHILLNMPQLRVLGNLKVGKEATQSDRSHIDKVQFHLPSADIVTEFEYLSEAPISVLLDSSVIETLPISMESWKREVYIFRDIRAGIERTLVFDNTDFPRVSASSTPIKKWAVRDVRSTPLQVEEQGGILGALRFARIAAEKYGQTSDSAFNLLRALQRVMMVTLHDATLDSTRYAISPESIPPDSTRYVQILDDLIRRQELGTLSAAVLLESVAGLTADVDSELWRRTEIGLHLARTNSKQKLFVAAHDQLSAVLALFREGEDHRWDLAQEVLMNKKIIPKKVRENPGKFRKREEKRRR